MLKMQVIGNLGKDCKVNDVNGKKVMNFSVAHTESWMSNGEKMSKTIWVDCAYWNDKTGLAQYLKKGTQVHVDGTPDVRQYDTNDGGHGVSLTLKVFSVQLLGGNNTGSTGDSQPQEEQKPTLGQAKFGTEEDIARPDDDLPF